MAAAPARALLLLLLLLFALALLLQAAPSQAGDTVAAGRPLSGGDSLVSKRGKFRLGFFQPGCTMERCEFSLAKDYRFGAQVETAVPWPTFYGARNEVEQAAGRCKKIWETNSLAGTLKGEFFNFLLEHKDGWEEEQVPLKLKPLLMEGKTI